VTFRDFENTAAPTVGEFYRLNHRYQTLGFACAKKAEFASLSRGPAGVWEVCERLNMLVDASDTDTDLSQLEHLLQTAEAARCDNQPDWLVLTGLVHDLGKILALAGEPQWAVVGDTFPLGCPFDKRIVHSEFFKDNPDTRVARFQQGAGIYKEGTGLRDVTMSWGHDEYMYMVAKPYLPKEALFVIRYHSFYAAHDEGAYDYLMNDEDRELMNWVRLFRQYDLYSKSESPPDTVALKPYYTELIRRFFPETIEW
jgi:inositol oxygenase